MASAASPSTPSGGVGASMWAGQPPNKQWGRSGEAGSAFRGGGRGRPGRGGGRGGRAGRGGGRANGPIPSRSDDKAPRPNGIQTKESLPSTLSSAATGGPANDVSASAPFKLPNNNRMKDTKPTARKLSEAKPPRKLPPIVIEPPAAAASNSPISATTPNRSRRKRSTNKGPPSISSSKKSPSTESSTSYLRAEKSPVITKDLPPHLATNPPETPSFDIKHDIDALVERVRAVAMDRPNTPGSHIDWAGEDDDSLPDLDDWGVKSVTDKSTSSVADPSTSNTSAGQPDLISPILADALKPLPSIELGSPFTVPVPPPAESPEVTAPPMPAVAVKDSTGDNTPRKGLAASRSNATTAQAKGKPSVERSQPSAPKHRKQSDASTKQPNATGPAATPAADKDAAGKKSPGKQANVPLHPSLPAKPVDAIDALTKRVPRKPVPPVHAPEPTAEVEAPLKSGLSDSMHVIQVDGVAAEEQPTEESATDLEPQGVAASMHASTQSAPSHITTHSTPSVPSFQPSHGRAHTIGRPGAIRGPLSPTRGGFPDGHPDERISRRDRVNHARTHSSPPTGPGTSTAHSRTVHASRPVITVDALSRLARTLGGTPLKREVASASGMAAAAAAAKD